jgi:3'-phosphoadenosine 5'-phosphosulfate sulfotransferase (PAPS reductase)/FAD synthetase
LEGHEVDLTQYRWVVVNTSAGKDSQAMSDVVCELAKEQGVLDRVVFAHADLGDMEWEGVRELAAEHAAHYGVRFEVVRRSQGDLLEHVRERRRKLDARGKFDAPAWFGPGNARYCTSDHKRGPIRALITHLVEEARREAGLNPRGRKGPAVRILNCLGMRAEESNCRAAMEPFEYDEDASNGKREVWTWLPLHAWTKEDVWARIRRAGTRWHWAYDIGMSRLSCCFCVMAPKSALLLAGKHNPALLDRYVEVEREVRGTFKVGLALADVQRDLRAGVEPGEMSDWAM